MSSLQCADVRNRFTTLNPVPILLVSLECTKLGWFDILRSGSHPAPVPTPVLYICSLYLCTWLYPVPCTCTWESLPSCTPPRFHPVRNQPRPNLMHLHLEHTYILPLLGCTHGTHAISPTFGGCLNMVLEIYIRFDV